MQLFYTPDILPESRTYVLSEAESKHAVRVLRLQVGSSLHLVDGRGGLYAGTVTDAHPKRTTIQINQVQSAFEKRPYYVHLAVAPTKNIDRIEWLLEKVTEIGVDEITPIICEHSERKEVKIERLNKVMVAAMKQSLKAYLPQLNEPIKLADFLKSQQDATQQMFIAHCADGEKSYIADHVVPVRNSLILIGPEGDFSATEIETALAAGCVPVTLGTARLRTETAALTACLEIAIAKRAADHSISSASNT